jgi:hypothetical protein
MNDNTLVIVTLASVTPRGILNRFPAQFEARWSGTRGRGGALETSSPLNLRPAGPEPGGVGGALETSYAG